MRSQAEARDWTEELCKNRYLYRENVERSLAWQ